MIRVEDDRHLPRPPTRSPAIRLSVFGIESDDFIEHRIIFESSDNLAIPWHAGSFTKLAPKFTDITLKGCQPGLQFL